MSENDLYGDLQEIGQNEEVEKLKEALHQVQVQLNAFKDDEKKKDEHIAKLVKEKEALEQNMAKIHKTAIEELRRKEQQIVRLQQDLAARQDGC